MNLELWIMNVIGRRYFFLLPAALLLSPPVATLRSGFGNSTQQQVGVGEALAHPIDSRFRVPFRCTLFQLCPELNGALSSDIAYSKLAFVPSSE